MRAPAGEYQLCPAADVLGPYDLNQLNYWIQSWLQTSCNTCLIQKGPDSVYSTPGISQQCISHPVTVLAKNSVSILTILGTCWVPDLKELSTSRINTSVQFSLNSHNLHISLPVVVSSKEYPWKLLLIETVAVSILNFNCSCSPREWEDLQDLG